MDTLLEKLKDYSRFLELQDRFPCWESERQEKQMRLTELQRNLQQKQLQLDSLQAPAFFEKLFGKADPGGKTGTGSLDRQPGNL